jgi:DNA-binding NtrC family response regulator
VAVNCGAIASTLIESELFGHERGSFTGANAQRKGVFELADGGTLFLDEIGEMPMDLQVRLLRVLETGRIVRIGGAAQVGVDVRLIAATNRDPEEAVRAQRIREDLYYRLSVFPIRLPTLRERREDVPLLAEHFLGVQNTAAGTRKSLSPRSVEALQGRAWPGNVRELRNVVERAFILTEQDVVEVSAVPRAEAAAPPVAVPAGDAITVPVGTTASDAERMLIEATLAHCGGVKTKAAEVLGLSLKTLYNRLNAYRDAAAPIGDVNVSG